MTDESDEVRRFVEGLSHVLDEADGWRRAYDHEKGVVRRLKGEIEQLRRGLEAIRESSRGRVRATRSALHSCRSEL